MTVQGPTGRSATFGRALVDPGADDTVLPLDVAELLAVFFFPATNHSLRWRGQRYPLRYGHVTLELVDDETNVLTWPAVAAFTAAPLRYPLLGICGCLEFLDVTFRGAEQLIEVQGNASFPPRLLHRNYRLIFSEVGKCWIVHAFQQAIGGNV